MIAKNAVKHAAASGTWIRGIHMTFAAPVVPKPVSLKLPPLHFHVCSVFGMTSLPVILPSSGCSASKRARSPEASITPVDSSAFCGAMKTGACWKATPRSAQRCARAAVPLGDVVV